MINMHMISKIFVDTNVFIASRDNKDNTHKKTLKLVDFLSKSKCVWYTSSNIILETLTVMSQKLGKDVALDWYNDFIKGEIREIFIDEILYKETLKYFKTIKSKNVSFVDCSSVITMKRNKIDAIFSFDEDFRKLGVKLLSDVLE